MNIHVCLVTHTLTNEPRALMESLETPYTTWHLFCHSDRPDVQEMCETAVTRQRRVFYYPYRKNRGLARSWNDAWLSALDDDADAFFLLNDDMIATQDDFYRLWGAVQANPDAGIVALSGKQDGDLVSMSFGFCALTRVAYEEVGLFDQNYTPIYWEDTDWSYRLNLAGLASALFPGTGTLEHLGSATQKATGSQAVLEGFQRNHRYYIEKWGGTSGAETFETPFGERLSPRITRERRHDPYSGYGQ